MFKKIKSFLFENRSGRQTVAKNTAWLSISNYGGRIIKAALIIYAARVLDTTGYGLFSYAVTLAGFVGLFLDPGINFILIRETSRATEEGRMAIFSTTFVIKAVLLVIGVLIVLFVAPSFSTLAGAKALIPVIALILTFDTCREFFSSLIRAREKMEVDAGIFLLTNASVVIFGFIFLFMAKTPGALAWGYVLGTAVGGAVAAFVTFPYLRQSLPHFSWPLARTTLQAAWPFAVIGTLGLLLTNTDVLVISWMRTASDVGIYAAVTRIVQLFYVIPAIIQTSTMPAFARLASEAGDRFRNGFVRTLGFIFLCSVPLGIGGALLGTQVMTLVFGTPYVAGGPSLSILMFALVFDFPASVIGSAIFAYNHQRGLIVSSAIAGISNVVFDLILIPRLGITGSAIATLLAQAFSNWYLWSTMNRINQFSVVPKLGKMLASGALMGCATLVMAIGGVEVVINVVASAALYFALLWALKEPFFTEVKDIVLNHARA